MVKGVNKTVIEVNDTGSRMFEKIVFYVSPKYGNISAKRLKKAAGELARELDMPVGPSLRVKVKKRRRMMLFLSAAAVLLVGAVVLLIVI